MDQITTAAQAPGTAAAWCTLPLTDRIPDGAHGFVVARDLTWS